MKFSELMVADVDVPEQQAPDSLKELAYHRLEERIVRLELAPGLVITEKGLADSIGIGRTPVREAIQRLAMAGLLIVLPRRGIKVSEVDACSVLRLLEVSRVLDIEVAKAAATRSSLEQRLQFARLGKEFDLVSARNDAVSQVRLDSEVNNLCMAAMGNEHASKMCRLIQPLTRRFWFAHHGGSGDISLAPRLHGQAARALAEGNEDKAAAAFTRINDYLESFVRSTLRK
ncbi:MAG: GntR family transcriptional regulator [Rhodospirillaceae bacterium]|nr:GntR family transcriptional regulator [Rhodospirillaceae bacterium]